MWNKVNELFSDGLNKTQIGLVLGLHRQTVSKYLSLSEDEFISSASYDRHYGHKLDPYYCCPIKLDNNKNSVLDC